MKTEGTREHIAFMEAKNKYLATGKRYSALLKQVMELDPRILEIAEEILSTGDNLSLHDNRFIISFYNELKTKSKINKKYFDILLELKKTRSELDNAIHVLSARRIAYLLRQAGIPPRRTNHGQDSIVSQINSSEISLIEKISLPGVLDVESSESLEELIAGGELAVKDGKLVPETKSARNYIRNLEKDIRGRVNNDYFTTEEGDLLRRYSQLDRGNLLEFIRLSADEEHIRELERRIDAGDIAINNGKILPVGERGKRYLNLLTEELGATLNRKLKKHLLDRNDAYITNDPRVNAVTSAFRDLDISVSKHQRLDALSGKDGQYRNLVQTVVSKKATIREKFTELMTLQEAVSISFADIKKQLLGIVKKDGAALESILAILIAVRYLSIYEKQYEKKLTEIESLLGLSSVSAFSIGPESITKIKERYADSPKVDEEASATVRELIADRLSGRRALGPDTNETLVRSLLNSPAFLGYKDVVRAQAASRRYVVDTLHDNHCLYGGLNNISEILADIAELEVEKSEQIVELVHELELAHKELWLARIKNDSACYIDTNFADVSLATKEKALAANNGAIGAARNEIRQTLAKYRAEHKKHGESFQKYLRESLAQVSKGGDIAKISLDLKKKYAEMQSNHEKLLNGLERDIVELEKRLFEFEELVPKGLEKALISDIRSNI